MNSKNLGVLSLVALVALGGGVWLASERAGTRVDTETQALYSDLKKSLNDATAVRIHTAGDTQAVEIARKDDAWGVTQRHGYPADEAKLRKLLLGLANAQLREEKTSNPKNYASLGVEDVAEQDATGVRLEVTGVTPTVNLIIGKRGPGLGSQYVRKADEERSWLINVDLDTSSQPEDWLRKSIVDVSADRIQSATIETQGAKPYTAAKSSRADADFAVEPLPKGKELSSASANNLATALAGLTLSDVKVAGELEDKPDARATYRTFDGLIVELEGWSQEDDRFITVSTRYDQALADGFKLPAAQKEDSETGEGGTDDAATKENDAAQTSAETKPERNVADEAAELSKALDGWAFEIPSYKYDAIFKELADLLRDKE